MQFRNRYFLLATILLVSVFTTLQAQDDKSKRPSPLVQKQASIGDLTIAINYGSPAVKGRKIFGGLEAYGKVWRTGANEATTFEVNKDVTINGEQLTAGKYALFTIPGENEWIVIFNKQAEQWGAYNYDEKKDALRVTVKSSATPETTERLMFNIDSKTGKVIFMWEKVAFSFDVKKA